MKRADWVGVGLLALTLAAAGCGSDSGTATEAPAATSPAPAPAAQTQAAGAPGREILTVLSVEHEVDVLAERDGVVVEIVQDEGSAVQKGSVLGRLDDREVTAQSDRARADLNVHTSDVKYNEAELKAAQAAYRRAQEMRKLGLNSDADLEEAEFKAKGGEHNLAGSKAALESAQAEVRRLDVEVEKTRLRAPFNGVVARRYVRGGQNVLKDDKCFRVSELRPLLVRFLVPETAGGQPRVGAIVNVAPISDSQRVYPARIQKVSPTVDPASGSYEVMAQLTGPDLSALRPGMSVRILWEAAAPTK